MKLYKSLLHICIVLLWLTFFHGAYAQIISGPTTACRNLSDPGPIRYTLNAAGCTASWEIDGADITQQTSTDVWIVPTTTFVTIQAYYFCSTGSGSSTLTLQVIGPVTSSVTLSGPSSVVYGSAATFTATATVSGNGGKTFTFYVNNSPKQSSASNTFSTSSLVNGDVVMVQCLPTATCGVPSYANKTVTVTNMPTVTPPKIPLLSENTCGGNRVATFQQTSTSTMGYYWQGTDSNGTSTSSAGPTVTVTNSGIYYIRAKDLTTGIWSIATAVQVDVDPVDVTHSNYNVVHARATNSIVLKPGFAVTAGNVFTAKPQITSECNDVYNWTEELQYDQNGNVAGDSRTYYNGMGNILQGQLKMFNSSKVLVFQPIYDSYHSVVGQTLPAPIMESTFVYKPRFITNASGAAYSASDFDKVTVDKINNPNPVGNMLRGSLGWYYSANNDLEPHTPVTSFPYSRSYTPEGPSPTVIKSAAAGNEYRMGSGHEAQSERTKFLPSDLAHYTALRGHFTPNATAAIVGYKYVFTSSQGDKRVSFEDVGGNILATARIDGANYFDWNYNYYNDAGQLVASVAPNGVVPGNVQYPKFVTLFKYDHLSRLIESSSTDEGITRFVYSQDGKLRFSETAQQRADHKFSYTNYDKFGRPIESGEYVSIGIDTGVPAYVFQPSTTTTPDPNSVLHKVENIGFAGVSRKEAGHEARCLDYAYVEYDRQSADFPGVPSFQENLFNQVSRTENAAAVSWFTYNEFGEMVKSWKKMINMGNVIKTISYAYDYFGNVTQVSYQEGDVNEDFYHYYEYDKDRRLSTVYTSTDGVNKTLTAKYHYYLHGGVKRVELGNNLQGIDFVYNINDGLKFINHSDPEKDPGGDGISGKHVTFRRDLFGEAIDLHGGDYQGAQYDGGSLSLSNSTYPDQFGGSPKAIRWHSVVDSHTPRAYAFTYDNRHQLENADWGNISGENGVYGFAKSPSAAYQEGVTSYDSNGNIQELKRNDPEGNTLADFRYEYTPNTNRLSEIRDNASNSLLIAYQYDLVGRMTQQIDEDKTLNIRYNSRGLVEAIRNAENELVLQYAYDDVGNCIQKTFFDTENSGNAITSELFYVYDDDGLVMAVYEKLAGQAVRQIEIPVYGASRLGVYKPVVTTTFFELVDHLGSVRGVIGKPDNLVYTATMEDNGQVAITNPRVQEMASFENLATTEVEDTRMNKTAPSAAVPVPNRSAYLKWVNGMQGNEANDRSVGPAIGLKVEPGDKVDIETWAKFKKNGSYTRSDIVAAMASILGNAYVGTAGGIDVVTKATQVFQDGLTAAATGMSGGSSTTQPFAYVYYLLYDKSFEPITQGYAPVPALAGFDPGNEALSSHQRLQIPTVNITQPGYIYIFVTNETENTEVWFDDLSVKHTRSDVVAGGDFYPFGLAMENREMTREDYRYGYQGQFSEKNLTTGMQEFALRNYDPKVGRWTTPDPFGQFASPYLGMGNTPHISVDPSGGETLLPTTVITAAGNSAIAKSIASALINSIGASVISLSGGCPPVCEDLSAYQFNNEDMILGSGGASYPDDSPGGSVAQQVNPLDKYLENAGKYNTYLLTEAKPNFWARMEAHSIWGAVTYTLANDIVVFGKSFAKPFIGGEIYALDGHNISVRERQTTVAVTLGAMLPFKIRKLPIQEHHFATNKHRIFTKMFKKILAKYESTKGLDLDGAWNKMLMRHLGRHPHAMHEFVAEFMEKAAKQAGKSQAKFFRLYDKYVKQPIVKNPELLRKSGWVQKKK